MASENISLVSPGRAAWSNWFGVFIQKSFKLRSFGPYELEVVFFLEVKRAMGVYSNMINGKIDYTQIFTI